MEVVIRVVYFSIIFLFGIVIGSFLNVCILRIPQGMSVSKERSHCMSCGYVLKWYNLIPLFSYLFLKGRCQRCKARISIQYPVVEALNGILYVVIFLANGYCLASVVYCLVTSALIIITVIDWRTFEIPSSLNYFIFAMGLVHLVLDWRRWQNYVIGFFAISVVLWILFQFSAMGGGDVRLMAAAGLLLGWQKIIAAFLIGCILGSIFHLIRMKLKGAGRVLAMGPYLSIGIFLSMLWGQEMVGWYLRLCGIGIR